MVMLSLGSVTNGLSAAMAESFHCVTSPSHTRASVAPSSVCSSGTAVEASTEGLTTW
jgi:hypothetical protein